MTGLLLALVPLLTVVILCYTAYRIVKMTRERIADLELTGHGFKLHFYED